MHVRGFNCIIFVLAALWADHSEREIREIPVIFGKAD